MYRIQKVESIERSHYIIQRNNPFIWFTNWETLHDGYSERIFLSLEDAEKYLSELKRRGTDRVITTVVKTVE